jgi:succinate dehydrogenase/fumarate reductase flavoprotein subunit
MAEGMAQAHDYMGELAKINGAPLITTEYPGNYPFPGYQDLGFTQYGEIPGFDQLSHYPHARGLRGGARHFKVLEDHVRRREIGVALGTAAERLARAPDGRIVGLRARRNGLEIWIKARRAVILACGGFEAAPDIQRQYLPGAPFLSAAFRGNTGDGIRMAQDAGAPLWHMWNVHGTYGFRHPSEDYPFGIRLYRLPDWNPALPIRRRSEMAWIVVDSSGRRYMNEYPPYMHDTGHRAMQSFDEKRQRYPRIPSYLIFDERGRAMYPMAIPAFNDPTARMEWSEDNRSELELGILEAAESVAAMARRMEVPVDALEETVARWNRLCDRGEDEDFERPRETMVPLRQPPFYYGEVWPIVSNTQGGPVHNEHWQVLDVYGEPIPGLYEAGELGGIWGHLYLAGGNLAECYIGGWTAARHAARNESW